MECDKLIAWKLSQIDRVGLIMLDKTDDARDRKAVFKVFGRKRLIVGIERIQGPMGYWSWESLWTLVIRL